jgi:glycosidase
MKKLLLLVLVFTYGCFSQNLKVNKIEPPNWWAGMKKNKIQLMIYGKNLFNYGVSFNTNQIKIDSIYTLENSDYSFIDISISPEAKPGEYQITFKKDTGKIQAGFSLLKRETTKDRYNGFNCEDIIYLIVPDRFSDGDTSNNVVIGMINDFNRDNPIGRHGGDLKGIINHLDYFNDLGVTALWLTPVLENNTSVSYHGYAATNLYKVDPRLGTNKLYKKLIAKAHSKGLKVIYDHVSNHVSTNHPWVIDPPTEEWINGTKENHLSAWHDKMINWDTHGAQITKEHLTKGWFVDKMADLNQRNPFVKNYLIQNTIWWIEFAGFDGIREDTYPYVDPDFTSLWAKEILNEYPTLNIVGEVWIGETVFLAPYQKDSGLNTKYNTNLPVVTDFALQNAYEDFLKGKSNLYQIYDVIAKDFLYKDPNNLLIFADNHDIPRAMFTASGNIEKVKIVFTHLLTTRGIPQIFYGTEIGIVGDKRDGVLRSNFPGGFPLDSSDAFTAAGRNKKENELYSFFKNLFSLRKEYKSLSRGELHHLPPNDNVYIYSKKYRNEKTLIILNGNDSGKEVDTKLIENLCGKVSSFYDITNNKTTDLIKGFINLKPMSANIYLII